MGVVLDASMALAWVFERRLPGERQRAERMWEGLLEHDACVLSQAHSSDVLTRLGALPIRTNTAAPLETRERVLGLGRSFQLSSCDAADLDLALRLGFRLASFDRALLAAAAAAGVAVDD